MVMKRERKEVKERGISRLAENRKLQKTKQNRQCQCTTTTLTARRESLTRESGPSNSFPLLPGFAATRNVVNGWECELGASKLWVVRWGRLKRILQACVLILRRWLFGCVAVKMMCTGFFSRTAYAWVFAFMALRSQTQAEKFRSRSSSTSSLPPIEHLGQTTKCTHRLDASVPLLLLLIALFQDIRGVFERSICHAFSRLSSRSHSVNALRELIDGKLEV